MIRLGREQEYNELKLNEKFIKIEKEVNLLLEEIEKIKESINKIIVKIGGI